jgi:hypothetical protein
MPTILCTISSDLIELALQRLPKILLVPVCYILPVLKPSSHSCTQAIIVVVLAINDKHTLLVNMPTIYFMEGI